MNKYRALNAYRGIYKQQIEKTSINYKKSQKYSEVVTNSL